MIGKRSGCDCISSYYTMLELVLRVLYFPVER